MAADRLGDLTDGHALVGDCVEGRARRRVFQRAAEQARGVEAVHGRPAVGAVADVAGDALVAGDADDRRHEAVVAVAVHGGGSRTTDERTPRSASERSSSEVSQRVRGPSPDGPAPGSCPSRSVASVPARRRGFPEAITSGRSEPASASPKVSMAWRSAVAAPWKSPANAISWLKARWMTPSESAASSRSASRSSRLPRCTSRRRPRGQRPRHPSGQGRRPGGRRRAARGRRPSRSSLTPR